MFLFSDSYRDRRTKRSFKFVLKILKAKFKKCTLHREDCFTFADFVTRRLEAESQNFLDPVLGKPES